MSDNTYYVQLKPALELASLSYSNPTTLEPSLLFDTIDPTSCKSYKLSLAYSIILSLHVSWTDAATFPKSTDRKSVV